MQILSASWQQFLEGLGADYTGSFLGGTSIPESARRFMDPYVRYLIGRAGVLGKDLSKVGLRDGYSVKSLVGAGIATGAEVTTQLRAVFGEEFRPIMTVMISKVRLADVENARRGVGLTKKRLGSHEGGAEYSLLDNSPQGLNRERLKELGLGDALGCPASMKVSQETKEFLKERGVDVSSITMLEDFATMTADEFDHYVGEWYRGLSAPQRKLFVESETRRVIDGTARRAAIEGRVRGSFSHGLNAERK